MSILSQQICFPKATSHHTTKTHFTTRILGQAQCAATAPSKPKTKPNPGPSSIQTKPKLSTTVPAPKPGDPDLQSTWTHRVWVTSGCTSVLLALAQSSDGPLTEPNTWAGPIILGLLGYIVADLASGVYHWAIDNYGNKTTFIFGPQIKAFQGHHKWPWSITIREFANNMHSLGRVVTLTVLPLDLTVHDPTLMAFVGAFSGFVMFSQQFHAWAHSTKSKLPRVVVYLQDVGVLVSKTQHGAHHRPPYNSNYCIVSGIWNEFLDRNKVFEVLEMVIFFRLGLKPRSWGETSLDWIEDTSSPS